jgi:hypothetical protein
MALKALQTLFPKRARITFEADYQIFPTHHK